MDSGESGEQVAELHGSVIYPAKMKRLLIAKHKAAEAVAANDGLREQVDFLLLCSQSVDYKLPSSSCILQHRLGLKTSCGAFDFNLGCSGYEYGLAVAKGLIGTGIANNVLLLTARLIQSISIPKTKEI